MINKINSFLDLLKEHRKTLKTIVIIHTSLGGVCGKVIEVKSDYIIVKVFDKDSQIFYNITMPICTILAIEEKEEEINEESSESL